MRTALLAWASFILAGAFIAVTMPLGEGFDEPWHLAYIQYLSATGRFPTPTLPLSTELQYFLNHHPIGWRLHDIFPQLQTQEDYWKAPESQRESEAGALRAMKFGGAYRAGPPGLRDQYESHQPPLYYVISALPMAVISRLFSLPATFLMIRLWSALIASAVVPLTFLLAQSIAKSETTAGAVTALVALFPGVYPDVIRVSNDALAVPVAAGVFLAATHYIHNPENKNAVILGVCFLIALCTKAFFIPMLIALLLALLYKADYRGALRVFLASAPGWLWYIRNLWLTGSFTGLPETVEAHTTLSSSLRAAGAIDWIPVMKEAVASHIWMGNWSLLQYRSWMYEVVVIFFGIGLLGFFTRMDEFPSRPLRLLTLMYAAFLASLAYYATQIYQSTGDAIVQGWYLSPFLPVEALAFVIGIEFLATKYAARWVVRFIGFCSLALLVYGNAFIAAPYYSGLIAHVYSGHVQAYHPHWKDVLVMGSRLVRLYAWIPAVTPALLLVMMIGVGFLTLWSAGAARTGWR